jgi:cyclopropane fatty-acyl-phospholipid synthase-like methyltransferase
MPSNIKPDKRNEYGLPFFEFCKRDHGVSGFVFGDILNAIFRPKSVIEFGSGIGYTLAALLQRGVEVHGIDVSADSIPYVEEAESRLAEHIEVFDLNKPYQTHKKYDLAISIEMLEHLRPESANNAVRSICRSANICVITACPPVGRNSLHLNEQPFQYWVDLFKKHGAPLDVGTTDVLRSIMRGLRKLDNYIVPGWYTNTYIGVFRKP